MRTWGVGREGSYPEWLGYNIGCVFVQNLVLLYIITLESVDSLYYKEKCVIDYKLTIKDNITEGKIVKWGKNKIT